MPDLNCHQRFLFFRRVRRTGIVNPAKMSDMRNTGTRPGRRRAEHRIPKIYVGAMVPEEQADTFDAICMAHGSTRAEFVRQLIADAIDANQDLLADQNPAQEALIA